MIKILRITTVPISLVKLLTGQLKFMSDQGYEVLAVSSDGSAVDKFKNNELCRHRVIPLTRNITPFQDLYALLLLTKLIKTEKPLIVHTHTPKAGLLGMLAAKITGVPVRMHTVAGLPLLEEKGLKRKVLNFVEKLTYKCAHRVYPNSYKLNDIILQEGFCKPGKIKVLGHGSSNGIDTSYFKPELYSLEFKQKLKKELHLSDQFIYCFIGRIVKDKGINELVKAFDKLNELNKSIVLLLVGPFEKELDPLNQETEQLTESNPNIISVGYKEDIRPYLSVSDVCVLPSYREGFPNVVLQAGAMSVPCIVTDINGCNEIIEKEKNGLIVPVKDEVALASAMNRMYTDSVLRENMEKHSRNMVVDRFEQSYFWNELLKEYKLVEKELL